MPSRTLPVLPLLLAALAASACRDGAGPSGPGAVEASADSLVLRPGGDASLTARVVDDDDRPLDGQAVTWSSTDTTVATVSAGGQVRGVRTGAAEVVAASGELRDSVPVRVAFASTVVLDSVNVHVNPYDAVLLTRPVAGGHVQFAVRENGFPLALRRVGSGQVVWLHPDGRPLRAELGAGVAVDFVYRLPYVLLYRNEVPWTEVNTSAPASASVMATPVPDVVAPRTDISTQLTVGHSQLTAPLPGATVAYQVGTGAGWFVAAGRAQSPAQYVGSLPVGPATGLGEDAAGGQCLFARFAARVACNELGELDLVPRLTERCAAGGAGFPQDCQALVSLLGDICAAVPDCDAPYRAVDRSLAPGPATLRSWISAGAYDTVVTANVTLAPGALVERSEKARLRLRVDAYRVQLFPPPDPGNYEIFVVVEPALANVPLTVRVRGYSDQTGVTGPDGTWTAPGYPPVPPEGSADTVYVLSGDVQASTVIETPPCQDPCFSASGSRPARGPALKAPLPARRVTPRAAPPTPSPR